MRFKMHNPVCVFAVIQILLSLAYATPNVGIRADFLSPNDENTDKVIQSYSGVIKFDDASIPLDKTKMTDAKLLHMAVLAYNEMVAVWRPRNLVSRALPGAMAVIAWGDKLFFASTLRAPATIIKLANVHQGSVRENMDDALTMGVGTHAHGGGCAEINCIELLWDFNDQKDPDKGLPKPRIAIWVLPRDKKIDTNSEINSKPCKWETRSGVGYGCHEIVAAYGLEPIDSSVAPDATGDDDWKFSLVKNPRPPCT